MGSFRGRTAHGCCAAISCALFAAACGGEETFGGGDILVDDEPPTIAAHRPPPLSGGTLALSADGLRAIVADPDRDRVTIVDLATESVAAVTTLRLGDEPGRVALDDAGRAHVALRGSGELLSLDATTGAVLDRRAVCGAPRGVAFEAASATIYVACASGELVSLGAAPGAPIVQRKYVAPDLRDVVLREGKPMVSQFRSASLLELDTDWNVVRTARPGRFTSATGTEHEPQVVWRTAIAPAGAMVMAHQMARTTEIVLGQPATSEDGTVGSGVTVGSGGGELDESASVGTGAYTGLPCEDELVRTEISVVGADGVTVTFRSADLSSIFLPVDLAVSASGRVVIIDGSSGNLLELQDSDMESGVGGECSNGTPTLSFGSTGAGPIAAAYAGDTVVVATREPPGLELYENGAMVTRIEIAGDSARDTGFDLFHNANGTAGSSISCASCHPEGREDGHTWRFAELGRRRTQSLAGTIAGTAPYHWEGSLADLSALMSEVLVRRMGGFGQSRERTTALRSWIEGVRPVRGAALDPLAMARGEALFRSAEVGCATCHGGPALTDNRSVDVGTGAVLQTPSLVGVGVRAPLMHDGSVPSLAARLEPGAGGGDRHGTVSQLDAAAKADLVAYLQSL